MTQNLKRSIIQIRDANGTVYGTGFIINNNIAVTCAHVVAATGATPGDSVTVAFAQTGETCVSQVLPEAWRSADGDDIAILHLQGSLPAGVAPITPGSSENSGNHRFSAFGYPQVGNLQGVWAQGTILGPTVDSQGITMLQIRAQEIVEGMSGAPVLDTQGNRVVGMVTATYYNPVGGNKLRDVAFATPIEAIAKVYPHINVSSPQLPATVPDSTIHTLRSSVNQAPPLPRHFVPRPKVTETLKTHLLKDVTDSSGVLNISAILGLGGIGKSTLAAAMSYDFDIRQCYTDGVLWATLGQQPDLLFTLSNWVQTLGDFDFRPTSVEAASSHFQKLLSQKSVLLVLDDVWDVAHIRPFETCCRHGHILITTRRFDVAEEVGAKIYQMKVMNPVETLDLLSTRIGRPIANAERNDALQVAEAVGFLPLALELAAARIARGTPWTMLRQALEEEVAQLDALETPRRRRRERSQVEASFNLSLKALQDDSEETRHAFIWLGILPEDIQVTAPMVAILWQVDKAQAADILELLWNDALLLSAPTVWIDGQKWPSYRLHDLLRNIARRLLTTPSPHGLGLSLPNAHAIVLERYKQHTQNEQWHTLPNDGYIHVYLTWHMEQARQYQQIYALLKEETSAGRNGWYYAREQLGQIFGFLADVNMALRLVQYQSNNGSLSQSTATGLQIRYALIVASLNSLARNLPLPLLVALVEKKMWTPIQGLAYARQMLNLEQQVKTLVELSVYMTPGVKEASLKRAINIAQSINDQWGKTEILMWLAQRLVAIDEPAVALMAVKTIESDHWQAETLTKLIPQIPQAMLTDVLDIAQNIDAEEYKVDTIAELVPHLPENERIEILQEALSIAQDVTDEECIAELMAKLAPYLSNNLLVKGLSLAHNIEWEGARAEALAELAPYLPDQEKEKTLQEVIAVVKTMRYDEQRSQTLLKIAPHLPETLLTKVIATAWVIKSKRIRGKTLIRLAPYLGNELNEKAIESVLSLVHDTEDTADKVALVASLATHLPNTTKAELLKEALTLTEQVQKDWKKAELLADLVPLLPEELLDKTLGITQAIRDHESRINALSLLITRFAKFKRTTEVMATVRSINNKWQRAKILVNLTPYLADELKKTALQEALDASLSIESEIEQAAALAGLAPNMAQSGFSALALTAIRNIWYEKWQVKALAGAAPYLPESQLAEALELAQSIRDDFRRVEALVGLTPNLPESLLINALQSTQTIHDDQHRTESLLGLIPYLPEKLKQQAIRRMLTAVRIGWSETKQIQMLAALIPHLPVSQQEQLLQEMCNMIEAGQDENMQSQALIQLAPYLSNPFENKILRLIQDMENETLKADALSGFIPFLSEPHIPDALSVIQAMQDNTQKAKILAEFSPYIPLNLLDEFLEITQNLHCEAQRANVLSHLVSYLPESALPKVISMVQNIQDDWRRADALVGLALRLAQFNHFERSLAIARTIWDDVKRAEVLAQLSSYLPRPLKNEALQAAMSAYQSIWYAKWRAEVLAQLSPHLPVTLKEDLFEELITTVSSVLNEQKRAEALTNLIPGLPDKFLGEALKIIQTIQTDKQQAALLSQIIPHLPEQLLVEAQIIVRTLENSRLRAILLAELALYLPKAASEKILGEMLAEIWATDKRDSLEKTLIELVPRFMQLPQEQIATLWEKMLPHLNRRQRKNLLTDLHTLEPILSNLGGAECMADTSRAIQDVSCWWP